MYVFLEDSMDPFTYLQIVSRIDHYETMARQAVRDNQHAARVKKVKPPRRLTPKGERFILFPVRKHVDA
jgi:hypothetical protein